VNCKWFALMQRSGKEMVLLISAGNSERLL